MGNPQDPNNSQSISAPAGKDQNLNDMVAKVTIETPSGSSTKYYLLYRDKCYSPGSLLVGAIGGLGVGFYSRIFFEQWRPRPKKSLLPKLPFSLNIPEVRIALKFNGKSISVPLLWGNTVWWRVGSRAVLSSILYSCLECNFQGTWYRRTYLDCGIAGACSGAVFGFRGIPGRLQGSAVGALGFCGFAVLCRFLFL